MKDLKWERLDSNYLYKDDWFTARRDKCKMPDGRIVDPYYVMEYPNWVNGVAFTREGKILMIRQYRHALGEVCIEIPGGCIDPSDSGPEEAMKREFLEETGYEFDQITSLGTISANPSTNANLTYMFIAEGGEKEQIQHLDPNEEIEVFSYTPAEVMQLLSDNKIMQSMHVTCLYYAFRHLRWLNFNPDLEKVKGRQAE